MSVHARKRARGRIAYEVTWVSSSSARLYTTCLDRHLMPRLGAMAIRDIEPSHVVALQRGLRDDGVGEAMTQKVMVVLSGIMRHSRLLGRIERNPVQPVRIAQPRRERAIHPLAPETIERMRAFALARGHVREAALLSVMGPRTSALGASAPRPGDGHLIFPRADGAVLSDTDYRNCRRDCSHLFRELARGRQVDPEATILEARAEAVQG